MKNIKLAADFEQLFFDWKKLWYDFHIKVDLADLIIIPKKTEEQCQLIVLPRGMTVGHLWIICKSLFPCWIWDKKVNLDKIVVSKRTTKQSPYAVWTRGHREPDEDLKKLSANDLERQNFPYMTLDERLAFEIMFFRKNGKHLDTNHMTLCVDSRYRDGGVPFVHFGGNDEVGIECISPNARGNGLRGRRVFI